MNDTTLAIGFFIEGILKFAPPVFIGFLAWKCYRDSFQ